MKGLLSGMADCLFPPLCLACDVLLQDRPVLPLCKTCAAGIHRIVSPLCPICGWPYPATVDGDHLCGDCLLTPPAFSCARSLGRYEGTLLDAIHVFKYGGNTNMGRLLGEILAEAAYTGFQPGDWTVLIPVPLHVRRLRERTFNQSVLLARALSGRFGIPVDVLSLKRRRDTTPQVALGRAERRANIQGAFEVASPDRVAGQRVLLVDDVYTTGNTLNECARVLLDGGAVAVAALTLARALHGGPSHG